jgi:UDP-glucose 4-epimerase
MKPETMSSMTSSRAACIGVLFGVATFVLLFVNSSGAEPSGCVVPSKGVARSAHPHVRGEVGGKDSLVVGYEEGRVSRAKMCEDAGETMPSKPHFSGAGKRVLVTGAAGFIASHVVNECAKLGMIVVAADDMSGGFIENVPKHANVKFALLDVKDPEAVEKLFAEQGPFEYVYHLGAYAAEGMSHFIRSYNYRNNLVGTVELVNAAVRHHTKVFVFTSSIAAYGAAVPPIRETTPMHPEDPYGISKYAVELDLKAAQQLFGMDYVIFRPHNVYGPHQNIADKYRNVIGIFMNQILNNKPMTIFGDGEQTRAFSYIDDVAPLIAKGPLIPEARNQEFNVGAEKPWSLNQLATLVSKAMGVPDHKLVHLDKRFEVQNAEATHSKIKCYFDPGRVVPLDKGLKATADWVKARTKGFKPVEFHAVEVKFKMPPSWVRPDLIESAHIEHTAANNTNFDQSKSAAEILAEFARN